MSFAQFKITLEASAKVKRQYPWLQTAYFYHDSRIPLPAIGDILVISENKQQAFVRMVGRRFYIPPTEEAWIFQIDVVE